MEQVWEHHSDDGSSVLDRYVRNLHGKVDAGGERYLVRESDPDGYVLFVD